MKSRISNSLPARAKSRLRHARAAGPVGLIVDAWNDVVLRTVQREMIRSTISARTIDECFPLVQLHFPGGVGQSHSEISRFIAYTQQFAPQTALEIGSATSANSLLLVQTLPTLTRVICIDPHVRNRRRLRDSARRNVEFCFINGLSQREETVEKAQAALKGRSLDLLFIDGDHSFAGVFLDFFLYRDLVGQGGLIVFHDIVPDPRLRTGRPHLGAYAGEVPVVWGRLKDYYPTEEFVEDWSQDGLGIGVLRYDPTVLLRPADIAR